MTPERAKGIRLVNGAVDEIGRQQNIHEAAAGHDIEAGCEKCRECDCFLQSLMAFMKAGDRLGYDVILQRFSPVRSAA